jgi:DNA polymerase type B, organellar and viral
MEVLWRGSEYDFQPKTIEGGGDNYTKFSNIDGNIYGADTESVQLTDRYEVQCFTCSSQSSGEHLVYVEEKANVLPVFLEWFLNQYEEELFSGKHHFIYYHNLEYDWLQMVKNDPLLLELAKIGVSPGEDIELYRLDRFRVKMKKNSLFTGSAPHVKLRIGRGRENFTLYIFDTFSFFPGSLDSLAKDLKLEVEKMERQESIGKIDFRTIPDNDPEKTYFEKYAKIDSQVTRLAGEKIRELHRSAGMTKIRPSAPAYAINLLFHMMDENESIVTGIPQVDIMQLILNTYRGGRTGGIYHGKVENISVLDFHSSYPASMLSLPSFSPNMIYARLTGEELELDNVISILEETGNAFLNISGRETDQHYPSLLTTFNGKLTPVYGEFKEMSTTGYEFLVGVKSGGLTDIVIHDCIVLIDTEENPKLPFRDFASGAYKRKQDSEKGSVEYASAKLALNAAYGKLIESRSQTMLGASDARDYLPYIEGMEKEFGNYYYSKYAKALEHGKRLGDIYEDLLNELEQNFGAETLEEMKFKMFGDYTISGRIYGRYVTPAAASLITGCSRARLLAAMKLLKALYWDTDSVFVPGLSGDVEETNLILAPALEWLPANAVPVRVGDELGELDYEMINGSGYLAGVKRYYLNDPDKEKKPKKATHGIPALPKEKQEDIIASLATGKNYKYESKPKPLKAKESKRAEDIGSFMSRWFESQFHLDERLQWERVSGGWTGTVKPFDEMDVKNKYSQEELEQFTFQLEELKENA